MKQWTLITGVHILKLQGRRTYNENNYSNDMGRDMARGDLPASLCYYTLRFGQPAGGDEAVAG